MITGLLDSNSSIKTPTGIRGVLTHNGIGEVCFDVREEHWGGADEQRGPDVLRVSYHETYAGIYVRSPDSPPGRIRFVRLLQVGDRVEIASTAAAGQGAVRGNIVRIDDIHRKADINVDGFASLVTVPFDRISFLYSDAPNGYSDVPIQDQSDA